MKKTANLANCENSITVGIFGDSFGTYRTVDLETNWFNVFKRLYEKKYGVTIKIRHYAEGGTSLFDTYNQLEYYGKYCDMIFLFLTNPGRYPNRISLNYNKNKLYPIPNLQQIDYLLSLDVSLDDSKKLHDLKFWFKESLYEYHKTTHWALVDHIKSKYENLIIIPCFLDSLNDRQYLDEKFNNDDCLITLCQKQRNLLNIDKLTIGDNLQETEIICGHLVPEYSEFLGHVIYQRIKTKKWNFEDKDKILLKRDKSQYYREIL